MTDRWEVAQEHELSSWIETDMDEAKLLARWREDLPRIEMVTGKISRETKVLDVGCGPVPLLHLLPRARLMVAADPLNKEYQKKYPRKDHILYKDFCAEEIPYNDHSFDLIFCINALDHMKNPRKALREIFRVLDKGGFLYLEYENTSPLMRFLQRLGYAKHLSEYHPHLISTAAVLKSLGTTGQSFEVVELSLRPQFTLGKVRFLLGMLFKGKRMTSYEKSISSISSGPLGFLSHNLIILVERVGYFFDPQRFAYFTTLVIRKK